MSYLIIKKTAATGALRALASNAEDTEVMIFSAGNENDAAEILAEIDDDNWTLSSTVDQTNGETGDALVLPEKALT